METLILGQFTIADWKAFVEGYAGNPQDLIEEVRKAPEEFEEDINGAAIRRRGSIQSSGWGRLPAIDGAGYSAMMNHNYTA